MEIETLLNENQAKAATYLDGHLRIIAGAGSGKTRVVTYRIAHLIQNIGVDPRKILAITFTNKAANEMKERVNGILGIGGNMSLICTIHSLCVRILRQHIQVLGYPGSFIIMDEEDQKALLKKIYKQLEIPLKTISYKSALHSISNYKMANISPEKAKQLAGQFEGEYKKAVIYEEYLAYQEKQFLLDFDDLLLKTMVLFENYPDVLQKWQHKFQFIHVDEFQDVGDIEYRMILMLSKFATVCVVGDPDQTIYSFRGANIQYILDFDKDFVGSKTITLDRNYRSSKNILSVSNKLIRNNQNRLKKDLYTNLDIGKEVVHYMAASEEQEAEYVCDQIEEIINKEEGINYSDFLILYRANYLSRNLEQAMIRRKIDYRIYGGLKFFQRKEVKDALSYLRLVAYNDDLSFERIINVPTRGIGNKTLEKIQYVALNYQIDYLDALLFHSNEINFSSKTKKEVQILANALLKARSSSKAMHLIFEDLLEDVGYMEMLRKDVEENRIDNINELKRAIFDYQNANPETASIENYLQDIALFTDSDRDQGEQFVSMMSIHMAKGLESNYVFVIGLSEGIFPSFRTIGEDGEEGLEEERRLAYVAFTRAKRQLFLTDSQGYSFIMNSPKLASRFLNEIGTTGVKHLGKKPTYKTSDYITPPKLDLVGDNEVKDWKIGDFVSHDHFGKGVVVAVNGQTLDIAFSLPAGIKTLMASHQCFKKLLN
ncbi:ATP-dependent helicase [Tannockella kyphosi]|uniref:ATP-dependent helicase n=1 Tax=Tannockella kyphosi TaxID=2899121 RepID=UPI002012B105|nr:ATP-dependent helicase [Tannockella kyphosi]